MLNPTCYLHNIEQALLAKASSLLEELMVRESAGDVSPDEFLTRGGLFHVLCMLRLESKERNIRIKLLFL